MLGESLLKLPWGPSRLIKSSSFLGTYSALIQHADHLELEDNLPPYGLVFFCPILPGFFPYYPKVAFVIIIAWRLVCLLK